MNTHFLKAKTSLRDVFKRRRFAPSLKTKNLNNMEGDNVIDLEQLDDDEAEQPQQHQDHQIEISSSSSAVIEAPEDESSSSSEQPQQAAAAASAEKDAAICKDMMKKWLGHDKARNRPEEVEFFKDADGKWMARCLRCDPEKVGKCYTGHYIGQHSNNKDHLRRAPPPPEELSGDSESGSEEEEVSLEEEEEEEEKVSSSSSEEEEKEPKASQKKRVITLDLDEDEEREIYYNAYRKNYVSTIEQVAAEDAAREARKRLKTIL